MLGTTGFMQAGLVVGHWVGSVTSPQATPPTFKVGVAVHAGTSLQAGGLSLPQDMQTATGSAHAK
jgi:hypothetical protein